MKNYVSFRAASPQAQARALDLLAHDPAIPATPALTYAGPAGYPVNALRFRSTPYSGTTPLAAVQWRVGEIIRPTAPSWQSAEPWPYNQCRWETDWQMTDRRRSPYPEAC
jgi:hypothetical protein